LETCCGIDGANSKRRIRGSVPSGSNESYGKIKREERSKKIKARQKNKMPPARIELSTGKESQKPLDSNLMALGPLPLLTLHTATKIITSKNADK
jgi:hypothetical protein